MTSIITQRGKSFTNALSIALSLGVGALMLVMLQPQIKDKKSVKEPQTQQEQSQGKTEQPPVLALPTPPTPPRPVAKTSMPLNKEVIAKPVARSLKPPASQPTPQPTFKTVQVTSTELRTGGPLLRILEHGKGPSIEISWPDGYQAQNALFTTLSNCYGLTVAMMDENGNLFRKDDPKGQRWAINLDRYSGFVRQPSGKITRAERDLTRAIRRHHRLNTAQEVRIFPRRVDAVLLGSLAKLIGRDYRNARTIRAIYASSRQKVTVHSISVDGRSISGRIDLSRVAACRR